MLHFVFTVLFVDVVRIRKRFIFLSSLLTKRFSESVHQPFIFPIKATPVNCDMTWACN